MAKQPQSDSTLGTAGSGDGAPRPLNEDGTESKGAPPDPAKSGGSQDRPGSDPKNPGDFGHH